MNFSFFKVPLHRLLFNLEFFLAVRSVLFDATPPVFATTRLFFDCFPLLAASGPLALDA